MMAMPSASHILLIDDDEAFSYASAKALRNAGFEVSLAPDHRLALQILQSPQPIDLLITDIVMPGYVNGFALARMARMRRLELKVIYMTAYDFPDDEAIGKVLRKPLTMDLLVCEAGKALARSDVSQPS
jgi:CheY-like chemotaxis protein